jgi:hypothetical protein
MASQNKSANAGVHNANGIEFQKHCAIYLLFSRYENLQKKDFFICLEHFDDVLFCFINASKALSMVEAYQAKKSNRQWPMGKDMSIIIKTMTQTGVDLIADPHPKDIAYSHSLKFLSNGSIQLSCGKRDNPETELINESNLEISYSNLHVDIRANIIVGLNKIGSSANQLQQLDNVSFAYIDLPRTNQGQKDNITGQFRRVFGNRVNDHVAAIDALLLLFRDVENVLNKGNTVKLLDDSKRVYNTAINDAINVITSKVKAYDFWRDKGDDLANKLSIGVFNRKDFLVKFQNSFDLFKDLKQAEHRMILKYVTSNTKRWSIHTNEIDCINDIYNSFLKESSTNLLDLDLKAGICAAYLELNG